MMKYVIVSGRFETGSDEEKQGYMGLFGPEDTGRFFDLYFHWYNLVHEAGHCIVEKAGAKMSKVQEEMYVNLLAVAYYRYMGEYQRLEELEERLEKILGRIPAPMPEGKDFTSFYEGIWYTEQINNVMIYGYFQLRSVLEAFKSKKDISEVLGQIGIKVNENVERKSCTAEIKSENSKLFLGNAIENLRAMGAPVPEIRLELVDNPMIQCAREDN